MVSKLLTALAVAGVASAAGTNVAKFNAYWGQSGPPDESLRERCDEGADYISLSFVTSSPENNPSGYPGIGFAAHCWGTSFEKDGKPTNLLNHCGTIIEDLQYCRNKGIKMLLSIGGVWNKETADYSVSSEKNGRDFADFLWGAFGPYDASWKGPRPFDKSPTEHSQIDGFDFDLELPQVDGKNFDNKPWIAMADQFRTLDKNVIITGAPQCPTAPQWFAMKEMIQKAQFDALFIQFYNNVGCDLIVGNDAFNPNDAFNYNEWEDIIAASDKSKDAKLFVGIPAAASGGSVDGYVSPKQLEHIICKIAKRPSFGGISIWDMWTGKNNIVNGKSFNEHVKDILTKCGDHTTTTTTTTTTSTTSSTTSPTTTTTASSSSSSTTTTPSSSSTPTATSTPTSTSSSTSSSSSSAVPTSSGTGIPTSSGTGIPTSSGTGVPTVSSSSVILTTGPATTLPVTSAPWGNTTTSSQEMTTSTVFTTTTRTITSCAPTVTNCPARVVTETIALYTTVCPVTQTHQPPKPTATPSQPTGGEEMTTSTVYTTKTYTISKCPPSVTNCPIGQVTTETISVSTTVCPVTKTNEVPQPTQPAGKPPGSQQPSASQPSGQQPSGSQPSGSQPAGGKPFESVATTSTLQSSLTVVKTLSVTGPKTTLTVIPQPATSGIKCPGGPNCPAPTGDHNQCPGGPNCPAPSVSGTGAPSAPVVKPTTPVVAAGASSVAAGLVALVAAQIFLL